MPLLCRGDACGMRYAKVARLLSVLVSPTSILTGDTGERRQRNVADMSRMIGKNAVSCYTSTEHA